MTSYGEKRDRLVAEFRANGAQVGLAKDSSNLFRDRAAVAKRKLDVRGFDQVLAVDAAAGWIEAEGMTPFAALVEAALPQGIMPAVVPQLKSITLGGAAAGVGIEATSFKQGLVHHGLLEMDILVGDGRVLTCTPDNEYSDLFYGFANSYGSLGYALRLKQRTIPVKPYVQVEHRRHASAAAAFADLAAQCTGDADFVDGVVFGPNEIVISVGRFAKTAPYASDYHYQRIYYRSLRERSEDWLSTRDYLWRWDTDWFWCSKNLYAQNPLIRRLYGRKRLNSVTYTKLMRWNSRVGLTRTLDRLLGWHTESVIQDVDIPLDHAAEFLDFLFKQVGLLPIWLCPVKASDARFSLYPLRADALYVNFGFWDTVKSRTPRPPGFVNRRIEAKVMELNGIKSLYSDSYFEPETFWRIYNGPAYQGLKRKYDPENRFRDLYAKCVLKE
ncbi:MAG: FAD-binding oxidoreductase [Hydrogenophilaceae bacterium]|nr:FAD-binding oxidoreductase [Hydrogenophilaceae bacterium]